MDGARDPRSTLEAIHRETTRLLYERGYTSTSMRDIARAVGVLPGSLYVHISGKEQLLGDIVERGIDRFVAAFQPALLSDEPADVRMRMAIKAHMQVLSEDLAGTLVPIRQWRYLTGKRREAVVRKRHEYESIISTIVNDGVKSGDFRKDINPRMAVLTVIGSLNSVADWYSPEGVETAEQIADEIADVLIGGLGAAAR
jgi:TetR/AcrR family transcriptional regulator, cholesterol catabolism regulator